MFVRHRRNAFRDAETLQFYDDFEDGNLEKWVTAGEPTIEADPDNGGNNCLYLNANAEQVGKTFGSYLDADDLRITFKIRVINISSNRSGAFYVEDKGDTGNVLMSIRIREDSGNKLSVYEGDHWTNIMAVNAEQWYAIEIYDIDLAGETYKVKVDDVAKGTYAFEQSVTGADYIRCRNNNGGGNWFDDVCVYD